MDDTSPIDLLAPSSPYPSVAHSEQVIGDQAYHQPFSDLSGQCTTAASSSKDAGWKSFWLQGDTLMGFTILFALVWISLIVLWEYGKRNDGIAITLSTSHYSWAYGPTVILAISDI
ncbi:hypothetical protein GGR57DRAFT_497270 [Xylariaceae sp. FL1272]|nr:hypothetical protein GGR57DRAFT_497270 [Xylariaceae sp. FL1272]